MLDIPSLVLVFAVLLVVAALAEPVAARLKQPASLVLAVVGAGLAAAAGLWNAGAEAGSVAAFFADPPLSSPLFLTVFLPTLLFHAALHVDVRQTLEDGVPILVMAVVAVVVATLAIGVALHPFAGLPLMACLLLGAAVATTDPVAVIAVFDSVGAPERLVRLVEGESLLNDAAAITLFVAFSAVLTAGAAPEPLALAREFALVPLGGAAVGWAFGRAAAALMARTGDRRHAHVSLSLALPYLAAVVAEHAFHVSGVIAVVAAGLTLAATAPARIAPASWRYLTDVWDQLAFWASALIFLLAAVVVPRLLGEMNFGHVGLLGILVIAALAARAAVLFGLLPVLAALRLSPRVSAAHRLVILWGGLRGAATLALALAVTELPGIEPATASTVAGLATLFTLFTLLVQGTTMRPLMRALGLHRLSPVDAALRDRAVSAAFGRVAEQVTDTAGAYRLWSPAAAEIVADRRARADAAAAARAGVALAADQSVAVALAAMADRERALVLENLERRTVNPEIAAALMSASRRLLDGARSAGAAGYARAAARAVGFDWRDTAAWELYRRTGWTGRLERRLARRFELLLVTSILLDGVDAFAEREVSRMFGPATQAALAVVRSDRRRMVTGALEALTLQYPAFAEAFERRFLARFATAAETAEISALHEHGLINAEVERDLHRATAGTTDERRLTLDLGLDTAALLAGHPLFAAIPEVDRADLAASLTPFFVYPGRVLMRKGERADAAWFVSSGSLEVDTGAARIALGPGTVVGEMALLSGRPRSADVTVTGYSALLRLSKRDFDGFFDRHPALRTRVEAIAAERAVGNRESA